MEQRDYLLRQIEQMSRALASLIRRFLGMSPDPGDIQEATDEVLTEYLEIDLKELTTRPDEKVIEQLESRTGWDEANLELLSEVVYLNALAANDDEQKQALFNKALTILTFADEKSNVYSMERQSKIANIRALLN